MGLDELRSRRKDASKADDPIALRAQAVASQLGLPVLVVHVQSGPTQSTYCGDPVVVGVRLMTI